MADIDQPIDIGRVTHLQKMHRSEDDAGDPIPETFLLGADGARGHTWYDPSSLSGSAGPTDAGAWVPVMDGLGNVVTDGFGQAVMTFVIF